MPIQTTNPYTNQVVKTFDEITDAELEQKLRTAHIAYLSWRNEPILNRTALLSKVSQLMLERKEKLAT